MMRGRGSAFRDRIAVVFSIAQSHSPAGNRILPSRGSVHAGTPLTPTGVSLTGLAGKRRHKPSTAPAVPPLRPMGNRVGHVMVQSLLHWRQWKTFLVSA